MLVSLHVHNYAIIEDIQINFLEGMTVLTGETGAGKSLLIDSISLLLGQRADSDMIRYHEKKATIEGVFTYENSDIDALLDKYGIPHESNLTIVREILENGKNTIRLNQVSINLTILRQFALHLADLHIQNDTYQLLNPEYYLSLLSPMTNQKYEKISQTYTLAYARYLDAYKKYQQVQKGQKDGQRELEFLLYEQAEISGLGLKEQIDVELEKDIAKLKNYDKVFSNLSEAYEKLENDYFSLDGIYEAASHLKKIADYDEVYQEFHDRILDSYYILDEIKGKIHSQIQDLDFNQEDLNQKIEHLNLIEKAKVKYKKSVQELMRYLEEITLKIDMVNHYDDVLLLTKKEVEDSFESLKKAAIALSDFRKELAKQIETALMKEVCELDLVDTKLEIQIKNPSLGNPFDPSIFTETGMDQVDFLVSFNPGEPLKPLSKVASGGELSRIMLAFKSYFSSSKLSFMVFDEIDTGVSGATAKKIALKMKQISNHIQVLCITHLPQVAAIGSHHIHMYKEVLDHRTSTHYRYLEKAERIEEIALMLSGDRLSLYALEHAKAMLEENEEKKG